MSAALCLLLQVAAPDVRVLGGLDFFGVTAQNPASDSFADAELGYALRVDVRHLGDIDLRLDFRDREGLTGNDSRHELHNLSLLWHGPTIDVTVGRFPVAGDFWLINDGARLTGHPRSDVTIEAYGGLRAFTSGLVNADLSDDPVLLPLVGAGVAIDRPQVHASLYGTYTQDSIDFYRGGPVDTVTRASTTATFIDGQVVWLPRPDLFAAGGFTLGSRYPVTFSSVPMHFTDAPLVDTQILGSVMAYALLDWSPTQNVRLGYAFDFDRVQVFVKDLPLDNTMTAAGGSFQDHTLKASVRLWRSLRAEARYRLRFRENTDVIHRFEVGARGDSLASGFGFFANFGADVWSETPGDTPERCSGMQPQTCTLYTVTGGISWSRAWFDARLGVLYTDAIGSGLAFSTHAQQAMGAGPTSELFPFVLDAQRIGFLRLFGMAHPGFIGDAELFYGLDTEFNFGGDTEGPPTAATALKEQLRMLFQLGYAR